jgi:organic radical activating enzyme
MIDTLRLAVTWACNYRCSYCCNQAPVNMRSHFRPVRWHEIDFSRYQTVCITGGEPFLLSPQSLVNIRRLIPADKVVVIYSNFSAPHFNYQKVYQQLKPVRFTLSYHPEHAGPLDHFVFRALSLALEHQVPIRIAMPGPEQPAYAEAYPELEFKFYEQGNCQRPNEEYLYLTELP